MPIVDYRLHGKQCFYFSIHLTAIRHLGLYNFFADCMVPAKIIDLYMWPGKLWDGHRETLTQMKQKGKIIGINGSMSLIHIGERKHLYCPFLLFISIVHSFST